MPKYVYSFVPNKAEGTKDDRNLLGGKGANLAEMANLGLPVPAGFTITTEVCTYYYEHELQYPKSLAKEVKAGLAAMEAEMGSRFGDAKNPLLVSVRSGARVSMPGMMDTVLNLGLNDATVQGLIERTDNPRFAYDAYRRFVQMYGDVVLDLKPRNKTEIDPFEEIIETMKRRKKVVLDTELDADDLRDLVTRFKAAIKERTGHDFPEDPHEQLWGAIGAVFGSWNNPRAIAYRRLNGIPGGWGTAVNVQAMVFGNTGEESGTGVAFTRDPSTGENVLYGEYLLNAQGEDVVAGTRTPHPIADLKKDMPKSYKELDKINKTLEKHFGDMLDVEFTIQQGKLWMLQCRVGKRTGLAAVRIAVEMVKERLISKEQAVKRVPPEALNQLLRPIFSAEDKRKCAAQGRILAKGLNAGPGAASGRVVFHAEDAEAWAKKGETVILTRIETSPEDIKGMDAAVGILTARGGMTSHAALVARQMGKVCVAGCGDVHIDYKKNRMEIKGTPIKEGDWISLDGSTGEVILGHLETKPSEVLSVLEGQLDPKESPTFQAYDQIMKWADGFRRLLVRTNADQQDQCEMALRFGAQGIGLCRTEHMFFGEGKIGPVREMILSSTTEERRKALEKLLPVQRKDFTAIFETMSPYPVTIRTLDPPLHEFLPSVDDKNEIQAIATNMGRKPADIRKKIEELHEFNPMLGHRGCRLGISFPEITEMQARAIFEAAAAVAEGGKKVNVEVMIPLVVIARELELQNGVVGRVAEEVLGGLKAPIRKRITYKLGTMIEIPRAALTADEIAKHAEFFSFGTNDLTQTTWGMSRDDTGPVLVAYQEKDIIDRDPFQTIDEGGVGVLMKTAVERGRKTRPDIKLGVCGEHGGDPQSVIFCHHLGLEYVSCSPFRIPIARLAAAQAALQ